MITSLRWIPKGGARKVPLRFELSAEEYDQLKRRAEGKTTSDDEIDEEGEWVDMDDDDEDEDEDDNSVNSNANGDEDENADEGEDEPEKNSKVESNTTMTKEDEELMNELNMDAYDNSDDDNDDENMDADEIPMPTNDIIDANEEFQVMEYGDGQALMINMDPDDEDVDDDEIKETDALFAVAVTNEDYSHLEVQVYDDEGGLFVHHDIALPEMPICMAWLDCPPFRKNGGQDELGNYMAVGMMIPQIEIWNLDVMDALEPSAVLGAGDTAMANGEYESINTNKKGKKKGKKGNNKNKQARDGHEDAVMALSWNEAYRQTLASGSADMKVKVWDVTTQACLHTFSHHQNKVQAVQWHRSNAWQLATGSFDKTIGLIDCRSASLSSQISVSSDMEALCWDPFNEHLLYCSLENGMVCGIDLRQSDKPLFEFQAHNESASSLSCSPLVPGMMATCSTDCTVKVWDMMAATDGNGSGVPRCVGYKSMGAGKLFTVDYYSDSPFLLACGGDMGVVALWESDELSVIDNAFSGRIVASGVGKSNSNSNSNGNSHSNNAELELEIEREKEFFSKKDKNSKESDVRSKSKSKSKKKK